MSASNKPPTQLEELKQQLESGTPNVSVDSHQLIEANSAYLSVVDHYRKHLLKNIDIEKQFKTKYQSIVVLNLCGNQLDDLPKGFASSLPNLETLLLSRNFFVQMPKELRNITSLKKLDLSRNGIKDIKSIKGSLKESLQYLDISGNLLQNFPSALCDCQVLTYLDISRNAFAPTPTKRRFSLRSQPTTFPKIEKSALCSTLRTLSLSNCSLQALPIIEFLIHLKSLVVLDASRNPFNTIAYMKKKIFMTEEIGVKKMSTEEELLPNLQELDLSNCHLTNISSMFLTTSNVLRTLKLSHNSLPSFILVPSITLSSSGLKSPTMPVNSSMLVIDKSERLKNLTYLDLGHNKIGNISDNMFKQFNKLQFLKLSHQDSNFDFDIFFERANFEELFDLNVINLSGLRLKRIPLGLNRRMQIVNISHNQISEITDSIFDMKNLRILKLSDNEIEEFDQERMKALSELLVINLCRNRISNFPKIFLQMRLQQVNLEHNLVDFTNDDEIEEWKNQTNVKLLRTFAAPNEILPKLFLGNAQTAQNPHLLKKLGITHILTVAAGLPPPFSTKFEYKVISIQDTNDDVLKKHFTECIEFIEQGMSKGGVLVHCKAGVSRSATIVIAFAMKTLKMSAAQATEFVKQRREQICPNTAFLKQLDQYSKELELINL